MSLRLVKWFFIQVTVEIIYVTIQACLYTCIVYFACGESPPNAAETGLCMASPFQVSPCEAGTASEAASLPHKFLCQLQYSLNTTLQVLQEMLGNSSGSFSTCGKLDDQLTCHHAYFCL